MSIDLYATERCPVGPRCESCGNTGPDVEVATGDTPLGVVCMSLCERCADTGAVPRMSASAAVRFVGDHCTHLGISVDEMAALMEAERWTCPACTSPNVANLGGYGECRECGHGFVPESDR